MHPRTALSTPLRAWRCPQCRLYTTTQYRLAVGPEHPRYIEVPEPPQQTAPYRPFIKGRLPVPRDIFSGAQTKDRSTDEEIAKATPTPVNQPNHPRGSREAWRQKMAAARRQNLTEGLKGLRYRTDKRDSRQHEREAQRRAEHEEAILRPEREDERLTTPSTGLDVQELLHGGQLQDPTRDARLVHKERNLTLHTTAKRANRMDNLHTLYMHARHFIVSPAQLDSAIDAEFGTEKQPRQFGAHFPTTLDTGYDGRVDVESVRSYKGDSGIGRYSSEVTSMWAYGRPASVQDMLDRATNVTARGRQTAMGRAEGKEGVVAGRVRRVAEVLTGGRME